jgi:hypothetical protein
MEGFITSSQNDFKVYKAAKRGGHHAKAIFHIGVLFRNTDASLRTKGLRSQTEISKGCETCLQGGKWGWRDEIPR